MCYSMSSFVIISHCSICPLVNTVMLIINSIYSPTKDAENNVTIAFMKASNFKTNHILVKKWILQYVS